MEWGGFFCCDKSQRKYAMLIGEWGNERNMKLQSKILLCVLIIVSAIISVLTFVSYHMEREQTEKQVGTLALDIAKSVATLPDIRDAFTTDNPSSIIQPIVERIRTEVSAEFIVVGNVDNVRYSHTDSSLIGQEMQGGDNDQALVDGESYVSKAEGSLGLSIRGKTPIRDDEGTIIGLVSVGFMLEEVESVFYQDFKTYAFWAGAVFLFGIIASILLANNIRRDTLGLEPVQIATLYQQRSAILESVQEGIIAVDRSCQITLINRTAKEWLTLDESAIGCSVKGLLPIPILEDVMNHKSMEFTQEIILNNRSAIIQYTTITSKGEAVGLVASFRDRSQVQSLVNTLSEIQQYSQDLRAQAHEYTNRIYTISGLLQMGKVTDALSFIHDESDTQKHQAKILYEQCKDPIIQAILLGKINRASEKKVQFILNHDSSLETRFPKDHTVQLITIIGNIIDNAFDAILSKKEGIVEVFFTDVGQDVIVEISDNGPGLPDNITAGKLFERGFTTKNGVNRGIGLALVKEAVEELNGSIECDHLKQGGAVFTVYIPKGRGKHEVINF